MNKLKNAINVSHWSNCSKISSSSKEGERIMKNITIKIDGKEIEAQVSEEEIIGRTD